MKNLAIAYLKELNKNAEFGEIITRLYYNDNGDYVQDLSFFANSKYMSNGLLNAIQNGQTLTSVQETELQSFIIEKKLDVQDTTKNESKYKWDLAEESIVADIINNKWNELKEVIKAERGKEVYYNFTINTAAFEALGTAKFTEDLVRRLKKANMGLK